MRHTSCALLALLALAGPALASPTVERRLSELPAAIAPDAQLVLVHDRAGAVRWGVNGWKAPSASQRPSGTTVVVPGAAVETPLTGPALDGKYRCRLGPFPSGVRSIEFVIRNDDGTWTKVAGRDGRVRVQSGVTTRRRPITVGRGPALGKSGKLRYYEDLQDWEHADCRGLDPADDTRSGGDAKDASRDLIAFYSRREAGQLYLRADFLDLGFGDERGTVDLVVLVDCAPGGEAWLPDFVTGRTAGRWNLAIIVRDGGRIDLWDATWSPLTDATGASFRSDLDAVELRVHQDALRRAGWDGRRALGFWVYTVKDGGRRVADAFQERTLADAILDTRIPETQRAGTAKYSSILHGNQAVQPLKWLHDLVESPTIKTPNGRATGYQRALDAHQLFRLPVNIHVSGTLAATLEWGAPAFNRRIRGFLDGKPETGTGALIGGVLAEHIMPYFENAKSGHGGVGMNGYSVKLNDELLDRIYGRQRRSVFWIPERVVRGSTFADVLRDARGRSTGYRYAIVDQVTHLKEWFGHADAHGKNGFKLNKINGVNCFIINDDADQWKFANTDGGLWVHTRRDLVKKALDPDQEQLTLVFDDWEAFSGRSFTSFGVGNDNPDNYETTLRWIANHPWIQVVTLDQVAAWNWGAVDRGTRPNLALETYDWLRHATEKSYDHWYFGSGQEESFADLKPERFPGEQMPKAFGRIDRPGGLFADVWSAVARAPAGRLRDLAAAIYSVDVFETAWHDEDMNRYLPKTATGEYAFPDTTRDVVSGWARAMHTKVGDAGYAAAAARWSASPPATPRAWREDADQDGEQELLLADGQAFYAFEPRGGRLVFAAVRRGSRARAFVCSLLNAPGDEQTKEREATRDDRVTRVHGLVDWWAGRGGSRYVNDAFRGAQVPSGWRLTSSDGKLTKTVSLSNGRLTVAYQVDAGLGTVYVRTGLAPAVLDLFMGSRLTTRQRSDGALVASAGQVDVALKPLSGARLNTAATFGGKGARGVPFAHQTELSGAGSFSFRLEPALR